MVMPSKKNICDFFSIFQQLNFILFNFPESGKFVQENIKIGRNNEFFTCSYQSVARHHKAIRNK